MFLNMHFLGFKMERARTPNVDLPSFAIETSKKLFQTLLLFYNFLMFHVWNSNEIMR